MPSSRLRSCKTSIFLTVPVLTSYVLEAWSLQSSFFSSSTFPKDRRRPTSSLGSVSLKDIQEGISQNTANNKHNPIQNTIFQLPLSYYDNTVTFLQRSTSTRIHGKEDLRKACQQWDEMFVQELGMKDKGSNRCDIERISMTSPTTLIIQWNVTYISPAAQWLPSLAKTLKWMLDLTPYNDQSGQVRKFSYKAVFRLFAEAIATQKLRVPLACIQGTTVCEFKKEVGGQGLSNRQTNQEPQMEQQPSETPKIILITEDLAYAKELRRGVLQNRLCAQDLQAFLETARRPIDQTESEWQDDVKSMVPWANVPELTDPLVIEQMEEEEEQLIPILFLGGVGLFVIGFACVLAPELIGQSLLGPPSYIVPPQELSDVIAY